MARWTGDYNNPSNPDDYVFRDDDCRDHYRRLQLAIVERMRTDGMLATPEQEDHDTLRRYLVFLISTGSASVRYEQQTQSAWVFWRGRWMGLAAFRQLSGQDGASDQERDHGAFGKGWKW